MSLAAPAQRRRIDTILVFVYFGGAIGGLVAITTMGVAGLFQPHGAAPLWSWSDLPSAVPLVAFAIVLGAVIGFAPALCTGIVYAFLPRLFQRIAPRHCSAPSRAQLAFGASAVRTLISCRHLQLCTCSPVLAQPRRARQLTRRRQSGGQSAMHNALHPMRRK